MASRHTRYSDPEYYQRRRTKGVAPIIFMPMSASWANLPLDLQLSLQRYINNPPTWLWPPRSLPFGAENSELAHNIRTFRNYSTASLRSALARDRRKLCRVRVNIS